MRRTRKKLPEVPEVEDEGGEPGMQAERPAFEIPPDFVQRKTGLNDSDVNALVRAVRAALAEGLDPRDAWLEARRAAGAAIESAALEGWKAEVMRRAGRPLAPVLPPKPAAAPPPPARPALPRDLAELLDIAHAALLAGRADLAIQVLRALGADGSRAPDRWVDRVTSGKPLVAAPAIAGATDGDEELAEDEEAPAPPRRPRAAKARTPKARRSA